MFNLEKQIAEWRQQMQADGLKDQAVLDELETHLREEMHRLRPEARDETAFHAAVLRLGNGKQLKHEFAKVERLRFWLPQNNPVELNILGACFTLWGLHAIISTARILFLAHFLANIYWAYGTIGFMGEINLIAILLLAGLHCVAGVGLILRRNFWRYGAFALAGEQIISNLYGLGARLLRPAANYSSGHYTVWMGWTFPMRYQWVAELFTLVIMVWACVYLSKPDVRNLFRSHAKTEIA